MQLTNIVKETLKNNGCTVSMDGQETPKHGYFVAIQGAERITQKNDFGIASILGYVSSGMVKRMKRPNMFFGTWINEDKVFLDLSVHYEDKIEAIEAGIASNQIAIWDAKNGKEITLPTPQKSGTITQQKAYMTQAIENLLKK